MDEKSCVTPAGTYNKFDVQNKGEENTDTHNRWLRMSACDLDTAFYCLLRRSISYLSSRSGVFSVLWTYWERNHTYVGVTPQKYKIYNIPYITAVAEYRSKMYQSSRLPSKKYRALPWGLSTTVPCTRVADYHPKIPCITVGAEYHGSMYQSGRLPSKKYRALPWCLNTAVNVTNLQNRYRGEPWKISRNLQGSSR